MLGDRVFASTNSALVDGTTCLRKVEQLLVIKCQKWYSNNMTLKNFPPGAQSVGRGLTRHLILKHHLHRYTLNLLQFHHFSVNFDSKFVFCGVKIK